MPQQSRLSSLVRAVLLVGNSASGKSPLGECLARRSTDSGGRFVHFDFGEHLRRTCDLAIDPGFSAAELEQIRPFMRGALLDDSSFFIARRIVEWFIAQRGWGADDMLVLNGLPRHTGQARDVAEMGVEVSTVIHLDCSADVAWRRKALAESGSGFEDRSGRGDSAREVFQCKLESYEQQTRPLLDWYRARGVRIVTVPVAVGTSPEDMLAGLGLQDW
jgi:adenylate kinase